MLGKLIKYDLKWTYKVVIIFYILALIFSIIGRCFTTINNSLIFTILVQIMNGCAIGMMVSSLINTLMRSWVRFNKNTYKDESYLTHTLPIKRKTLYLSKVLSGTISIILTCVMILICIAICYWTKTNMENLKNTLNLIAIAYNTTIIKLVLSIAIVFTLEMVFTLLSGYLGIILGHKFENGKMGKSVLIGMILYFATQCVTLLIIYIIGLFNANIMNLFNTTNMLNANDIKLVMICAIIIYAIYIAIYYLIGRNQFEKSINVE